MKFMYSFHNGPRVRDHFIKRRFGACAEITTIIPSIRNAKRKGEQIYRTKSQQQYQNIYNYITIIKMKNIVERTERLIQESDSQDFWFSLNKCFKKFYEKRAVFPIYKYAHNKLSTQYTQRLCTI